MVVEWGRNALEDPWVEPSESMFTRSVSPEQAPDQPSYIEIDFEKGDPVAVNGSKLSPASLLAQLNKVGLLSVSLLVHEAQGSRRVSKSRVLCLSCAQACMHPLLSVLTDCSFCAPACSSRSVLLLCAATAQFLAGTLPREPREAHPSLSLSAAVA